MDTEKDKTKGEEGVHEEIQRIRYPLTHQITHLLQYTNHITVL